MLALGSKNLNLVATLQLMAQLTSLWFTLPNAVAAQEGMNLEGEVEGSTACRHRLDFSLWSEDEDF